jgi:hypothetical protein
VVGAIGWPYLRSNYRSVIASRKLRWPAGTDDLRHAIKALAVVKAGTTVTLTVPANERAYLRPIYGSERVPRRGVEAVTLAGCRQTVDARTRARECRWKPNNACGWPATQFAGGFYLDYDRAPTPRPLQRDRRSRGRTRAGTQATLPL